MNSVVERLTIPGPLSVVPAGKWSLSHVSREHVMGAWLVHVPSGVQLDVRELPAQPALPPDNLEVAFARYMDGSWPGARLTERFPLDTGLRGIAGVFEGAMPGAVVREWLVSNGKRFANAATYATTRQWEEDLLKDSEALIRSIRFE